MVSVLYFDRIGEGLFAVAKIERQRQDWRIKN
jgi:hypothetical protein